MELIMAANMICPQCGKHLVLDLKTDRVICPHCGYVRPDEISALDNKETQIRAHGHAPSVELIYKGEIASHAQAAFDSGQMALFNGDQAAALESFRQAADAQDDFVDAHLWIAKTADDEKTKRDELGTVLALSPNNLEALRMLMVLDGKLTPEQAARTLGDQGPQLRQADTVATTTNALICPKCGGALTVNDQFGRVECRFCGYSAPQAEHAADFQNLTMALLVRKAQPVRWNVGARIVTCQQCGEEHTIAPDQLTDRCRFCGSTEVIVRDAVGSFTQPDGILPFTVTQEQAQESIKAALSGFGERLVSFVTGNKVNNLASSRVQGVYMPFWTFDMLGEVTRIKRQADTEIGRETTAAHAFNVAAPGVKSPPPDLTTRLGEYDWKSALAYDPQLLATTPAQLYSRDFDEASLDARATFSKGLRDQYMHSPVDLLEQLNASASRERISIDVFVTITNMTFRLLLLPVWIATLNENNGKNNNLNNLIRLAVVNGQTAHVALGNPHKVSA